MEWSDFIGNNLVIRKLQLVATDAKMKGGEMPHLGFFGPPGCGKTTMGKLIANYVGRKYHYVSATAIKEPKNLLYILRDFFDGGVVLLDECHRLPGKVQDVMLPLLEKPCVLQLPNKSGTQINEYPMPKGLTFVLATTHSGMIRDALTSRLIKLEFHEYTLDERGAIAGRYLCRERGMAREDMDLDALMDLGARSRSPREIEQNADQVRRYMDTSGIKRLTKEVIEETFKILDVDCNGLTKRDKDLLEYLTFFKAVGIKGIAAYLNMPEQDVLDKIEPWLIRNRMMIRTPKGRAVTPIGLRALNGDFIL